MTLDRAIDEYIKDIMDLHYNRIVFNGNNYSDEWKEEAARRGLPNLVNTPMAHREFINEKNIDLLTRHRIFDQRRNVQPL